MNTKFDNKKFEELKEDLAFTELEERLEMVQLAAISGVEADAKRCNGSCADSTVSTVVN